MVSVGCYKFFTLTLTILNLMKMKKIANILLTIYMTGTVLNVFHKVLFNPHINSTR